MSRLAVMFTSSIVLLLTIAPCGFASPNDHMDPSIEHGRYLSVIAGCNDCHTAGFAPSGGKVPESDWLKGDTVGYRGPWGTTYPINLRLYMSALSEEQWLKMAHSVQSRPPMPSYALNLMAENDLRSLYRFVRSLGDAGQAVPAYVPPDKDPGTMYIPLEPVSTTKEQK